MSELTDLVAKQNEESYQLGKKHGAIEELEKIKAEIEGINKSNDSMYCVGVTNTLIILDKHIYELKGEQEC